MVVVLTTAIIAVAVVALIAIVLALIPGFVLLGGIAEIIL